MGNKGAIERTAKAFMTKEGRHFSNYKYEKGGLFVADDLFEHVKDMSPEQYSRFVLDCKIKQKADKANLIETMFADSTLEPKVKERGHINIEKQREMGTIKWLDSEFFNTIPEFPEGFKNLHKVVANKGTVHQMTLEHCICDNTL